MTESFILTVSDTGAELPLRGAIRCDATVACAVKATSVWHNSFSSSVCVCVSVCPSSVHQSVKVNLDQEGKDLHCGEINKYSAFCAYGAD